MSPYPPPTIDERVRQLLALAYRYLRSIFPDGIPRWLWTSFRVIALGLALFGSYYAWKEFPTDLRIEPIYFVAAAALYVVAFHMHLLGWHTLSSIFFGNTRLRDDAEAYAGSNLVKYLPTIAWYIANRSHYYKRLGVPQQRVVAASLAELAVLTSSGTILLASVWAGQHIGAFAVVGGMALIVLLIWLMARYIGGGRQWWRWAAVVFWYGSSWFIASLMLAATIRAMTPISSVDFASLLFIWLLSGLVSYVVTLTLGAIGILREITLTILLAQHWPLAIGVAAAIGMKLLLTLGEIVCSLLMLSGFLLWRRLTGQPERDA